NPGHFGLAGHGRILESGVRRLLHYTARWCPCLQILFTKSCGKRYSCVNEIPCFPALFNLGGIVVPGCNPTPNPCETTCMSGPVLLPPPGRLDEGGLAAFFRRMATATPFLDNRVNGPSARDVDVAGIHQVAFGRLTELAGEALQARRGIGA